MHEGAEAIYAKVSLDSGDTWQPEVQASGYAEEAYPQFPAIASNGTHVHLVWGNSAGIQYSRSSDLGEIWSSSIPVTNTPRQYLAPRIAVAISQIQVVTAGITGVSSDVFYLSSTDGGKTWNAPLLLTAHEPNALSLAPVISSNGEGTFVAWEDNRNGHFAIFFLSRPNFLFLRDFEWRLFAAVAIVLVAATSVYVGIELRETKQRLNRRIRRKTFHRRAKAHRRTKKLR
jgi:Neuraminidase (sialidase)